MSIPKKRLGLLIVLASMSLVGWRFHSASAAFNPNKLMDDSVFDNTTAMTSGQIDSWLNQFPNSCISSNNGFAAPDPNGYNPSQGYLYGGAVSAGRVIFDAAQAYSLNPQILLATLQKEEGLVRGDGPYGCSALAISASLGYGCPDSGGSFSYSNLSPALYYSHGNAVRSVSGTCVNTAAKAGFSQQIIHATWLFKFGEQRSKGNVGWAVINGNWDNSDDLQTCYGGPMTQGYRKRCPSDSNAVFYDGYITIDGSATHMDTGATAALYWYTPHFHGNQNFDDLFTQWFGSTSYYEPVGGVLYNQSSSGRVYLVTTDTNTKYLVPGPSVIQNYTLNPYQIIPADDTTIAQFTDGGSLTSMVEKNSNIYLVNNGVKYHIPGPSACTDWGLDCFNSNKVTSLGSFQDNHLLNGGELPPLGSSNYVVYKMDNGSRLPMAGLQTMADLGYSWSQVIALNSSNVFQPLGPLLLTRPTVIAFSPNPSIYYFDGQNYHYIPGPSILSAWGFNTKPISNPPRSSYNSSPPAVGQPLNIWTQIGTDRYLIDAGRKLLLDSDQQQFWPSAQFQSFTSTTATGLPTASLRTFAWASPNFYRLENGFKRYIPTHEDLVSLGSTSLNTQSLSSYSLSLVNNGNMALGTGSLVRPSSDTRIFVISGVHRFYITNPTIFNSYGFDWAKIRVYPDSALAGYPQSGDLSQTVVTSAGYGFIYKGVRTAINTAQANDYGLKNASYQTIPDGLIANVHSTRTITAFVRNNDNGAIYYGSGGALHYVTSNASFMAYGGGHIPITPGNSAFINSFTIAQPI